MLSAIAARKAAKAANPGVASPTTVVQDERSRLTIPERQRSTPTKRKSSDPKRVSKPDKKKRKKDTVRIAVPRQRYFQQEQELASEEDDDSEDVIIIDSKSTGEEGSSGSDGDDGETLGTQVTTKSFLIRQERAWSPSRVVADTDSEGEPITDGGRPTLDLPVPTKNWHRQDPLSIYTPTIPDTTFTPKPGQNVFKLDGETIAEITDRPYTKDIQAGTAVSLTPGETISLLGCYGLTVLQGVVNVLGTDLYPSSQQHHVFAPKCSPLPVLTAIDAPGSSTSYFFEHIPALKSVSSSYVVLLFQPLQTGVEGLGRVCRTFSGVFDFDHRSEDLLGIITARIVTSSKIQLPQFILPPSWQRALTDKPIPNFPLSELECIAASSRPFVGLVKGPKRSGKSTFARTLLNKLLKVYKRVAYLECDVGQTEFTPPGLVSLNVVDQPLFGPPFTHPFVPYQSHYIGSATPRDSPSHYLASISALYQTYKLDLQYPQNAHPSDSSTNDDERIEEMIPLVVNTMGWTKGLGADLLRKVQEVVEPTGVYEVGSGSGIGNQEGGRHVARFGAPAQPMMFTIEPIPPSHQSSRFTAADWRTISLLSYFHSTPSPAQFSLLPYDVPNDVMLTTTPLNSPRVTWSTTLPLLAVPPYVVDVREALDNAVLVGAGTEDVVPSEIARVLNGALVALVRLPESSTAGENRDETLWNNSIPYTQGTPPPDPLASTCIGLALIRGVSSLTSSDSHLTAQLSKTTLQILTPLPPTLLRSTSPRTIVKGPLEIPIWGMLDHREFGSSGERQGEVPFLQWGKADGVGGERRRVRRNLMRKSQMES